MHTTTQEAVACCLHEASAETTSNRRLSERVPFFRPITLTADGGDAATLPVFSRDISPRGIGLLHNMPLENDRVTLEIPFTKGREFAVTTEIGWCVPAGAGFYFSGGNFARLSARQNASLLSARNKSELNRRFQKRYPFFRPVVINVKSRGNTKWSAFSRDISRAGIGLLHNMPVETGRVLLTMTSAAGDQLEISAEIRWCSSVGEGWYVSGGRFATLLAEEVPARLL